MALARPAPVHCTEYSVSPLTPTVAYGSPRSHPDHTQITRMQATEITDAGIAALKSKRYDVCRINYANPDMVGP